jgi:hypothetical protein
MSPFYNLSCGHCSVITSQYFKEKSPGEVNGCAIVEIGIDIFVNQGVVCVKNISAFLKVSS